MKVAFSIITRDRAHRAADVEKCVRAAFAQTYSPMEIVLSDQGSTDGTLELLERLAAEYSGPNTVRVLRCPDTADRGMAGLNAHLAWLMKTLECDYFIQCSDDDYSEPERTAKSVEALERTGADMVGCALHFAEPGERPRGRSSYQREGFVSIEALIMDKVGGSSGHAWRRTLWDRVLPVPSLCGVDVWLPMMAALLGGFYFINTPLHTYVQHADPHNTGYEGMQRALPKAEHRAIDEHRFFQTATAYQWVLTRMRSLGVGNANELGWIEKAALAHYEAWSNTRVEMTLNREAPQPFRI